MILRILGLFLIAFGIAHCQDQQPVFNAISHYSKNRDENIVPILMELEKRVPRRKRGADSLRRAIMDAFISIRKPSSVHAMTGIIKRYLEEGPLDRIDPEYSMVTIKGLESLTKLGIPEQRDWLLSVARNSEVGYTQRELAYQAFLLTDLRKRELEPEDHAKEVIEDLGTNGYTEWHFFHHPLDESDAKYKKDFAIYDSARCKYLKMIGKRILPLLHRTRELLMRRNVDRQTREKIHAVSYVINQISADQPGFKALEKESEGGLETFKRKNRAYEKIRQEFSKFRDLLKAGKISKEEYARKKAEYRTRIEALEAE